jgi:type II secretory ATPase GspE/PulE/Tfp pilus assembly ATPase PilB-like protein
MSRALALPPEELRAWQGRGCEECNGQGERGRLAIYEFFVITEEVADLIGPAARVTQLREAARRQGWRSLREMCWMKVQAGLVPISEQQRMTRHIGQKLLAAVR